MKLKDRVLPNESLKIKTITDVIIHYTLYSLSVFSLAILQLILEISATCRLVSYLLADK